MMGKKALQAKLEASQRFLAIKAEDSQIINPAKWLVPPEISKLGPNQESSFFKLQGNHEDSIFSENSVLDTNMAIERENLFFDRKRKLKNDYSLNDWLFSNSEYNIIINYLVMCRRRKLTHYCQ
ncbi:hypothetical protein HK096_002156, partial [Nowakowskiella sp. JEL0078]